MAGEYGEIDSRLDYHRVLGESLDIVRRILARAPTDGPMLRINKQLEAMKRWTDGGREPTDNERRNIDVGLVAARELSETTAEISDLTEKLLILNNYFEDWPTDARASNANDEDSDDD
jgi:hypothetical protein